MTLIQFDLILQPNPEKDKTSYGLQLNTSDYLKYLYSLYTSYAVNLLDLLTKIFIFSG